MGELVTRYAILLRGEIIMSYIKGDNYDNNLAPFSRGGRGTIIDVYFYEVVKRGTPPSVLWGGMLVLSRGRRSALV